MSRRRMVHLVFISFVLMSLAEAYPIESKPLNNNPDTWNFGEGWLIFNPRNSADPSASALIGSDPHIKKSKITPKSIFIAPNAFNGQGQICPHGFRVDDNGKCIKIVTINQDEILAARISELFGVDNNPNQNSDSDTDYYDFDDEVKSDKDSGPLQFNLPLAIDIEEDVDGTKVEYIVEEKVITMRNLNLSQIETTERLDEMTATTAAVTETTESVSTEEPAISSTPLQTEADVMTTTEAVLLINSTLQDDEDEISTTEAMSTTTVELTTTSITTTTQAPSTSKPTTMKTFSVDFLPKTQRKTNRMGQASARLKNSRDRDKFDRPRKQKTTAVSLKSNEKLATKLYKIDRDQVPKKNRTRGSKRPGHRKLTTTTEVVTESALTTPTPKPFWWLPKGWSIDETKEKPVLVRFWSKQPLAQDERARSHESRQQRVNSRMPTDNIFREITAPELETVMQN